MGLGRPVWTADLELTNEYLDEMAEPGTWGGHAEVVAATRIFPGLAVDIFMRIA